MRKINLFLGLSIFIIATFVLAHSTTTKNSSPVLGTEVNGSQQPNNINVFNARVGDYHIVWAKVEPDGVVLIPNFDAKENASTVYKNNGCKLLINAGFYSSDKANASAYAPIGLFVTGGKEMSGFRTNKLFNGILSINDFATPRITDSVPQDHLDIAVQTGPILIQNATGVSLKDVSEKTSRRSIAAVTGDNKLIFMSIYGDGHSFSGPSLQELPALVKEVSDERGLNIADAINLDGGSASAFYSGDVRFSEASPVGSFFCVK